MLKIVTGDLVDMANKGLFDVILHGANCFHTMGAGIAKTIKEVFPVAYAADLNTPRGLVDKVGEFSVGECILREEIDECDWEKVLRIVNLYTQFEPGANAEYAAIKMSLCNFFAHELMRPDAGRLSYGFPLIGCGIGGLAEEYVIPMIEAFSVEFDITIVKFPE